MHSNTRRPHVVLHFDRESERKRKEEERRRRHASAALWASTNSFITFHFPGDSAVVHFKGVVELLQVWFVLRLKRRVSCLFRGRNQRGNTESICPGREGTAVVHRRGIESGKAVPPPPPPPPTLPPPPLPLPPPTPPPSPPQKAGEGCEL